MELFQSDKLPFKHVMDINNLNINIKVNTCTLWTNDRAEENCYTPLEVEALNKRRLNYKINVLMSVILNSFLF
jgi:hypothetical protein